jgi:hypothetical protein
MIINKKLKIQEDLKDDAKKYFGTVSLYQNNVGLYINTDGSILDGSGELLGNTNGRKYGQRAVDHREISNIMSNISGDKAMIKYMLEGNIRYNPESPGVEIIKEPTNSQYNTIGAIINYNKPEEFYIDLANVEGNVVKNITLNNPKESEAVNKIRSYFNSIKNIEGSKKVIEDQLNVNYDKALDEIKNLIINKLVEEDFQIKITGIDFTGSRRFGKYLEDSDLDIKFTYYSIDERVKEDTLFNYLNDEENPLYYRGFKLDIDPIENGNLKELILKDSEFRKRESLIESTKEEQLFADAILWSYHPKEINSIKLDLLEEADLRIVFNVAKNHEGWDLVNACLRSANSRGIFLNQFKWEFPTLTNCSKLETWLLEESNIHKDSFSEGICQGAINYGEDINFWVEHQKDKFLEFTINRNSPLTVINLEHSDYKEVSYKGFEFCPEAKLKVITEADQEEILDEIYIVYLSLAIVLIAYPKCLKECIDILNTYTSGKITQKDIEDICNKVFIKSPKLIKIIGQSIKDNGISLTENYHLTEDTRNILIGKSRNVDNYLHNIKGKNRWERKKYSKVSSQTKEFNDINMNDVFKKDILTIKIPVIGETDKYVVNIQMEGVIAELARNIKSNHNVFEFKVIIQALTKIFNTTNLKVKCDCKDYLYRYKHNLIINNNSVDDSASDPGPGKTGMTAEHKGQGCKHILLVLSNQDWIMKIASVIKNYILYMAEHNKKLFNKFIFPKLYNIEAAEAKEKDLIPEDTNLDTDKNIIDTINDWAKNRGKFKKGLNINPAIGKGKISQKEEDKK